MCVYSEECISNCDHAHNAVSLVESLPELNKQVLFYLLRFLKVSVFFVLTLTLNFLLHLNFVWLCLSRIVFLVFFHLSLFFFSLPLSSLPLSFLPSSLPPSRISSQRRTSVAQRWGLITSPWCGHPTSSVALATITRSSFKTLGKKCRFFACY